MTEDEIKEVLGKFDGVLVQDDVLVLNLVRYLTAMGLQPKIWERAESWAVRNGILQKGGYMDIKELLKEEGRQAGMQAGMQAGIEQKQQQVIQNMLQEQADIAFIAKVTGVSPEEVEKLKNGGADHIKE